MKTEAYLYDERSLLAEFGGALGLFLGFSFYMLWEIFEPIVISLKKSISKLCYVMLYFTLLYKTQSAHEPEIHGVKI